MVDKLSQIFDVEPVRLTPVIPAFSGNEKVSTDSDLARGNLKQLIETAKTALEHALEVCVESDSPRAYEVLANLINTAADLNTKLIDIHQREQKLNGTPEKPEGTTTITNNAVFVGTSSELNAAIAARMKLK